MGILLSIGLGIATALFIGAVYTELVSRPEITASYKGRQLWV